MTALSIADIHLCFEGAVPAVIATASSAGVPNVTYLSRVRAVDDERIALSNQFFSKTMRNLAENPRASLLLIDPVTYDEYRLTVVYERTERRGAIFERLRDDVEAVAAVSGMQNVFKLRAADIYRVLHVERTNEYVDRHGGPPAVAVRPRRVVDAGALGELAARVSRCTDLDSIVATTVDCLDHLLGYSHAFLMLLDERGERLFTIASHGFATQGVGSEIVVGEDLVGMAAARASTIRVGNLRHMVKYGTSVRRAFEEQGDIVPGREIPVPGLAEVDSRIAVPAMSLGQLIGMLVVESEAAVAFDETDEATLSVVGALVAAAIESERAREASDEPSRPAPVPINGRSEQSSATTRVRFFAVDGSTFLGSDYLIKGVAGRILWSLLGHYSRERRTDFTNKEVRLDPSLELPEFRDNLDSRLILLKRRLDERAAPIRIEKTGRGRFRLVVDGALRLEEVPAPTD